MCGICGIVDWNQHWTAAQRRQRVADMNEALRHRGPDGAGQIDQGQGSLAMRRLAIIDRSGGDQPIYNETRDICVIFNGEIYNFQSLKKTMLDKGHRFSTQSDTEVLVHLYEEFGKGMLDKLQGMFSFCIYDRKAESYFLARDRFGEKPLFYHFHDGLFSFSSEIGSLLKNSRIKRQLDYEALPYYFRTSLVPEPLTLLQKIRSLRPGHYLFLSDGQMEEGAYFIPSYEKRLEIQSEAEAIALIRPRLERAVQRQTISDVPIGAFLSGGIDSSTVVALLQQQSDKKISTFNVRFEDQDYDESPIARKVAAHLGTEHHELLIPNVDFDESIFWTIIDHVGMPFRDSSAIPSYLITREISKHRKVALSGDGGDELFGGYALFQWYQKILRLKKLGRPLGVLADAGLGYLQRAPGLNQLSALRKAKRGVQSSLLPTGDIPIALNEMFGEAQTRQLAGGGMAWDNLVRLKEFPARVSSYSSLRQIMYYRLYHTLPSNMLVKVDRMSMANSLEVRAPFLDPELFEATVQLPDHLLIHQGSGKYLLRKMMEDQLPAEVFDHPKTGFNIPLHRYQNPAFKRLAQRLLFDDNPMPELIPRSTLQEIYHRGISRNKNDARTSVFQSTHQLWMMMQLFGWAQRFEVQYQ